MRRLVMAMAGVVVMAGGALGQPAPDPLRWWHFDRTGFECVSRETPGDRISDLRARWGHAEITNRIGEAESARNPTRPLVVVRMPGQMRAEEMDGFWRSRETCEAARLRLFPPVPAALR